MSLFSSLPDEIILIIFSFINDYNDIKSIIGTSKKFKNLIECYHLVYFFPIDVEDSYFDYDLHLINCYLQEFHKKLENFDLPSCSLH